MIKRLSKHNDYKDIIKSCPSGVIDDIYAIDYYIQGHNETIQASFTKTGEVLEVILPSSDLETLPNGILMRRAFYKVLDASYPDGYYNLEFEDNMSVWLGEVESEEPVIPEYVTEEELAETLVDYATQDWVEDQGYLTEHQSLEGYATEQWVESQGYLTEHQSLEGYATEQWVSSQQFATTSYVSNQISGVQAWVSSQSYLTSASLSNYITESAIENLGFATESWVQSQGYLASVPSNYATQSWVSSQGYLTSVPSNYATKSWVSSQQFATEGWVIEQGYVTGDPDDPFVTESTLGDCVMFTRSGLGDAVPTIEDYGDDVALNGLQTRSDRFKGVIVHKDSYAGRVDAGVARYDDLGDGLTQAWFDPFVTANALSTELSNYATGSDLSDLTARVSDLEVNYGDAITIANNIIS